MPLTQLLALDLDGTVRQTKSGQTFINTPDDQQPIKGTKKRINFRWARDWREE